MGESLGHQSMPKPGEVSVAGCVRETSRFKSARAGLSQGAWQAGDADMIYPQFEHVHAEDGGSFRYIRKFCADWAVDHPWHFHPEFELTWIMKSHGTRYVGDYIRPYSSGEMTLYGPNLPHCYRNERGVGDDAEHITVQFDPRCFGDGFLETPEAAMVKRMLDQAGGALMFAPAATEAVGSLLIELKPLTGMRRLIRLMEILDRLSEVDRTVLTTPSYRNSVIIDQKLIDRLAHVQRYIDQRFRGVLSQSEIAGQLGMSTYAFSKFVRAATGNTFMGLLKLARINEACRLLADSSEKITDVALDCGYQHTSYFDRHFRELKGVSPSEYRRQAQTLAIGANGQRPDVRAA